MVATLSPATPVADIALSEIVVAPSTADFLDLETLELDFSPQLISEQETLEAAFPSAQPTAATRNTFGTAEWIFNSIATAAVLVLFVGAMVTIGDYARDFYDQISSRSPFELFRLLNVIP